jgi:cellulose synthase/poly-beta-1,6-N-acetylglucosamine synthase-like glycosyltransferase
VIGVLETRAERGRLSASLLDELVIAYGHIEPEFGLTIASDELPKASIVVPTICRRPDQLVRTVDSLLAQNYPDFEIIVVDNRTDYPREPLPDFGDDSRVYSLEEPRRGISAARNRGIEMASGAFVAFTDDDVVIDKNWLRVLGSRFATNPMVEGIGGLVLPLEFDTPSQLWFEEFYGGFSQSFRTETFSLASHDQADKLFPYAAGRFGAGCNMAFRTSTLRRLGGFATVLGTGTPTRGGEDLTLFFNLVVGGGTIAFEPSALVRHSHRRTEQEFFRQVFGYGTGLTAMYTAWVVEDPRHFVSLLRRVPAGFELLTRAREQRSPSATPSYPRWTILCQLLGMTLGPLAYVRSLVRDRRYR